METLQPAAILTDKSYIDKVKSINNFKNDNAINSTSITEQSCENSPIKEDKLKTFYKHLYRRQYFNRNRYKTSWKIEKSDDGT